jgi:hypothetical protein
MFDLRLERCFESKNHGLHTSKPPRNLVLNICQLLHPHRITGSVHDTHTHTHNHNTIIPTATKPVKTPTGLAPIPAAPMSTVCPGPTPVPGADPGPRADTKTVTVALAIGNAASTAIVKI